MFTAKVPTNWRQFNSQEMTTKLTKVAGIFGKNLQGMLVRKLHSFSSIWPEKKLLIGIGLGVKFKFRRNFYRPVHHQSATETKKVTPSNLHIQGKHNSGKGTWQPYFLSQKKSRVQKPKRKSSFI